MIHRAGDTTITPDSIQPCTSSTFSRYQVLWLRTRAGRTAQHPDRDATVHPLLKVISREWDSPRAPSATGPGPGPCLLRTHARCCHRRNAGRPHPSSPPKGTRNILDKSTAYCQSAHLHCCWFHGRSAGYINGRFVKGCVLVGSWSLCKCLQHIVCSLVRPPQSSSPGLNHSSELISCPLR